MLKVKDLWGLVDGEDVQPLECELVVVVAYTKKKIKLLTSLYKVCLIVSCLQ
jgi:hypothetical protein